MISGNSNIFILCIIAAFVLTLAIGPFFIPLLTKFKFGQTVRDDGPKSHLIKTGTPTMGGIIILFSAAVVSLFFTKDNSMIVVLVITLLFGLIGFADDYIKIVKKRSLGLRAYQKIIGQLVVSSILIYASLKFLGINTAVLVPFTGVYWDLGILYIPFTIIGTIFTVNSVNLTDGLDGLAAGISIAVLGFFSIIAIITANTGLFVIGGALIGALLGFLKYNSHPAQIFMGDTGSLALGGAIAALSIVTRLPLFILLIGGVFMAEALSVVIQVSYFRISGGKRIFKMAPLHHHFELLGWKETKVVAVFIITSIILCLIGFLAV